MFHDEGAPTCIPPKHLPVFEQDYGRPCPYVQLQPANRDAADLARLLLSEHRRALAPLYFETIADEDPDRRRALIERVAAALESKTVLEKLYPKREDADG